MARLFLALIGTFLGLLVSLFLWTYMKSDEPGVMALHHVDAMETGNNIPETGETESPSGFARFHLDEEFVNKFFHTKKKNLRVYDPDCHFRYVENYESVAPLEAHPNGRYTIATNSIGIRRDSEIAETKPELRIVVAGDSHVDGVCANDENFCMLTESAVNEEHGADRVEILNFGHGGYGFLNYLGVLHRCLRLEIKPDVFMVVVYGGNDFADTLLWHHFHGEPTPPATVPERRAARKTILTSKNHGHFVQYLFHPEAARSRPSEKEQSSRMARETIMEIKRICDENGIELIVGYIPSPIEVRERADLTPLAGMMETLGMTEEHLQVPHEFRERFLDDMDELGIEAFNFREEFEADDQLLYWVHDSHINLRAHELIAQRLTPWVASRLQQ